MRTKQEEIAILRETARILGADSYCGPWLKEVANDVERDIASDLPPTPTVGEWRKHCAEMVEEAKTRAAGIVEEAERRATIAARKAMSVKERLGQDLRDALRGLESW